MEERIQLNSEVCTVHKFAQLDHFAERHFVVNVELRSLNELIVRFVREIENSAVDVDAIDEPAEIQEITDFEGSLNFSEMEDDSGS